MQHFNHITLLLRLVSVGFVVAALAVFKPFGLGSFSGLWPYADLLLLWVYGVAVCFMTEAVMKYLVRMPHSMTRGVDYIIRRNLWFQCINTPLEAFMICLYRHVVLDRYVSGNRLSWGNYVETLLIIAFCSFALGLFWRYRFRNRYLQMELEETRQLNERLKEMQSKPDELVGTHPGASYGHTNSEGGSKNEVRAHQSASLLSPLVTLAGTTNESVTLAPTDLLYIEAVGNYVKVHYLKDDTPHTDTLRATMRQMEETLQACPPPIVRCHRAFLVNLQQVEQIVNRAGTMQLIVKHTADAIPVSRANKQQIREAIG